MRVGRLRIAVLIVLVGLAIPVASRAEILKTTDPAVAAAFMAGASLENFDDLTAFPLSSYGPGQTIDPPPSFNTRDGTTAPTFNSGGGTLNDPVGNPGVPIGIFDPTGSIADDFVSPNNVAGPVVFVEPTEPFNNGFIEAFFVNEVARVGFWVTHGSVMFLVFDSNDASFATGDTMVIATQGEFVGIDRGVAEIKKATLLPTGGGVDAFTIDDFVWSATSLIEPPNQRIAYIGQVTNLQGGVTDLNDPQAITTSPDGLNLYALGSRDDALVVFRRDPQTGVPTFLESHRDGVSGVDGLDFGLNVVVSPDGANVYVTASEDTVANFSRDPLDGSLTFLELHREGIDGVSGISQPFDLVVSPDGEHVYVPGHVSQAVAIFDRDPQTGTLQFQSAISEGIADVGGLTDHLCMSPDGRHLYVASFFNDLTVYARASQTGALSLVEVERFSSTTDDCAVSPDGRFVYVPGDFTSPDGSTIEILSRDPLTGEVSPLGASAQAGIRVGRIYLSPSGKNLYGHSASDAFAVFERDSESGGLRLIEKIEDGVAGVEGIGGSFGSGSMLVPSPDGRHLYAVGESDDSVGFFSTSLFRPSDLAQEGVDGIADALGGPVAIAVSPDGRFAYVASSLSDSVAAFEIDGIDDRLVYLERKKQTEIEPANGLTILGLDGASSLAMSPDGNQLYATGELDDSVVWFDRNPDGTLTFRDHFSHPSLDGTIGIAVTNDGTRVYATGQDATLWITFDRAPDGSLTPLLDFEPGPVPRMPAGVTTTPDDEYVLFAETAPGGGGRVVTYRALGNGDLATADSYSCDTFGNDVVVSGDGRNVYLTCASPGAADGSISALAWDASLEELSFVSEVVEATGGAIEGLDGAWGLAISEDDRWVAAAGADSGGFALFARDAVTGGLYLAQKELAAVEPGVGLASANDLEFTPDGRYLLVAGGGASDGTLALFVPEPGFASSLLAGALGVLWISRRRRGRESMRVAHQLPR